MKDSRVIDSDIIIRDAERTDWAPAIKMIWSVFMQHEGQEYSAEGVETFFEFLSSDRLHEMFLNGEYRMLLATENDRIVGAISLRNGNLLSLLFVRDEVQSRGVGRALIESLCGRLQETGVKSLVVKAAPGAVGFYEKCGFTACGTLRETRGIQTIEMKKTW